MLAAITIGEVVAGPAHAHMHKHMRNKKDVDWAALDWNAMGIDWSSAWAAGQKTSTPAPVATVAPATVAPAAAVTTSDAPIVAVQQGNSVPTTTASAANSGSSGLAIWHNLVGAANHITAFGKQTATSGVEVGYVGNIGSPIEGSNMMFVDSATGYAFTNEFINTSGEDMTIVVWNKAATPGLLGNAPAEANLGASIAPETPALAFALAPGQSQVVAFMDETVIAWAQACDAIAESGAFATTWGEMQYNSAGSGYDVSAIMNPNNNNYIMEITSVEAPACTSSNTQNYWLTASDPVGDSNGSCYIAQATAHLTTKMGGSA